MESLWYFLWYLRKMQYLCNPSHIARIRYLVQVAVPPLRACKTDTSPILDMVLKGRGSTGVFGERASRLSPAATVLGPRRRQQEPFAHFIVRRLWPKLPA